MSDIDDIDIDNASAYSYESMRFLYAQVCGDTEELELYRKGGLHPTHIGDTYDNERYRIVHKLGAGSFSTVWLARDSSLSKWVALKIVAADKSREAEDKASFCKEATSDLDEYTLITYSRHFYLNGPNGRHLSLVQPVLGPSMQMISRGLFSRLRPRLARRIASEVTRVVGVLHNRSLGHGDLTPGNVCFRLRNLDHMDDQEIYRLFGEPKTSPIDTEKGDIPGPEAPQYIVGYLDFFASGEDLLLDEICLIDMGEAFDIPTPPNNIPHIPPGYLAPEIASGMGTGQASDIWALGCLILHLRSGSSPWDNYCEVDCPAGLMRSLHQYFGGVPTSWGQILWNHEGQPTKDKGKGSPIWENEGTRSLLHFISEIWDESPNLEELQTHSTPPTGIWGPSREHRPYPECFKEKFWKPAAVHINDTYLASYDERVDAIVERLPKISRHEVDLLHDLLSNIFVYEPTKRIQVAEILAHPWFQMDG